MRRAAQANWSRLPNHNPPRFYTAWVSRVGLTSYPSRPLYPRTSDVSGRGRHFAFVPTADLPTTGVAQLIQKLFRRDQIGSLETLSKATVDRP
jgi:hypothetical protein